METKKFEIDETPDYESCEYLVCIYQEYDTGYREYGCCFADRDPKEYQCEEEDYCPLKHKVKVEYEI